MNTLKNYTFLIYAGIILILWYLQSRLHIPAIFYKAALVFALFEAFSNTENLFPFLKAHQHKVTKKVIQFISLGMFLLAISVYFVPQFSALINNKKKYAQAKQNTTINWLYDKPTAYAQATKTNKPMLIEFFADWCMPCRQMEINTFSDKEVQGILNENFIPFKVDATHTNAQSNQLMNEFRVNAFPSVVLYNPNNNKQVKLRGYIDAYQMRSALKHFLK